MIMEGEHRDIEPVTIREVDMRWLQARTLQLSDAPPWYSLRARLLGRLCASCDLGLPEYGCGCPPSEPLDWRPKGPIVLRVRDNLL